METQTENLFFTFKLDKGKFALEVTNVKEILDFESITKVPNAKPYMCGVMNIRGAVITVIDLQMLFGFKSSGDLTKTKIVVSEVKRGGEPVMTLGLVAEAVDVVTPLEIVPSDTVSYGVLPKRSDFVKAVGKLENEFVLILDLNKILSSITEETSKK